MPLVVTRPTGSTRLASLSALAALVAIVTLGSPSAGADPAPTMSISPSTVTAGQSLTVSVAGWPAGSAQAEVCGSQPQRGEQNCDVDGRQPIEVGADGSGSATLVFDPSVGCPCTVEIRATASGLAQSLPIEVAEAATPSVVPAVDAPDDMTTSRTQSNGIWIAVLVVGLVVLAAVTVAVTGWRPRRRRRTAGLAAFVAPGDDEVATR